MTTFEQTIKINMIRVGIPTIEDLASRAGMCRRTIFNRFKNPQGCYAYELEALAEVLGIEMGELAESCRKKKGKKIA